MKAHNYPDIPNVDLGDDITNLFHGLLTIQSEQHRKQLIEEVRQSSEDDLDYVNKMARLRNLGKI